jgi:hypothetical protein
MGGTDRMDQQISYYATTVRTRNWQHRIFTHFLSVAVVNAHILYKIHHNLSRGDDCYYLKDFIHAVVEEWAIPAPASIKSAKCKRSDPDEVLPLACHFPVKLPHGKEAIIVVDGVKVQKDFRRNCAECQKKSSYECSACNRGLCIRSKPDLQGPSCWEKFHIRQHNVPHVDAGVAP